MDNRQLLDIIVAYMRSLSDFGMSGKDDLVALIYLMFMKDFYEAQRNISLDDMSNDNVGLTDDMVRALNRNLDCIMCMSCLIDESALGPFPTKNHWMVVGPDDDGGDDEGGGGEGGGDSHGDDEIADHILYTIGHVSGRILQIDKSVDNEILYI